MSHLSHLFGSLLLISDIGFNSSLHKFSRWPNSQQYLVTGP